MLRFCFARERYLCGMSGSTLVIAHRGACGYRPEHSRAAYELAIAQGADAVETDVVSSSDGVLVVRHENELSLSTDIASRPEFRSRHRSQDIDGELVTGWFTEDFTWDELSTLTCAEPLPLLRPDCVEFAGTPILRLADLMQILDEADASVALVLELKHATHFERLGLPLEAALARELEVARWRRDDERLIIESFELSILRIVSELGIGAKHVYLLDDTGAAPDQVALLGAHAPTYASQMMLENLPALVQAVDGISIPVSIAVSDEGHRVIERCHELGMAVYTFTLRPENKFLPVVWRLGFDPRAMGNWQGFFDEVLDSGVDGVFVDHPDLVGHRP